MSEANEMEAMDLNLKRIKREDAEREFFASLREWICVVGARVVDVEPESDDLLEKLDALEKLP